MPGGAPLQAPASVIAAAPPPPAWQAPLPHGGSTVALAQWWSQFDDPLVQELVGAAQQASPTLASAASQLAQARASRQVAGAALLPRLDGAASTGRGQPELDNPLGSRSSLALQASWEIDLFGANAAGRDAAQARLDAAHGGWHGARVLVAAEAAQLYLALRACEAQQQQAQADARSRSEVARLSQLGERAGFMATVNTALARASAAEGLSQVAAQQADCERLLKSLVALTALDEPGLRQKLAPGAARLPQPALLLVQTLPAELLNQRPDLAAAAQDLAAAAAEVAQAQAQRWPGLSLTGSLGRSRVEVGGFSQSGQVWTLGPLQLRLPLFDGGRLAAGEDAARARYEAAGVLYRARLREAVREVETALVTLDAAIRRRADLQTAVDSYQVVLRGTETRWRSGMTSLFELEDARRSARRADAALLDVQRERIGAWIHLYKALGGGWPAGPAAGTGP